MVDLVGSMQSLAEGLPDSPGFDINNMLMLRTYLESLRAEKKGERSSWDPHWEQLRAYFEPRGTRFNVDSVDDGSRKDFEIINEEGMLALDILSSGMLTGMSNQTMDWFMIGLEDDTLNDQPEVREWCEKVQKILRRILAKSNFYDTLLQFYREQGLYGTSAFLIEEDTEEDPRVNSTIRCTPYPIGEYTLGLDKNLRQDLSVREISMTVRQMVERYGYKNLSRSTQTLNDSPSGGVKENRRTVIHAIHRTTYYGEQAKNLPAHLRMPPDLAEPFPWMSTQYELDSFEQANAILTRKGYYENPLIVGRWYVNGENTYGEAPAMRVLGSNKSVQSYEDRQAMGFERMIAPTMLASSAITGDARKALNMPGDVLYTEFEGDMTKQLVPAFTLDWGKAAEVIENKIATMVRRIQKGLFTTAFQAITDLTAGKMTAEETRARINEQIQILGPVVENNISSLGRAVLRVMGIAFRKHMLPKMPQSMHGAKMRINFESILGAAQRMKRGTNITTFFTFIGQEVAIFQDIADNVDPDAAARELASIYNVPISILRPKEAVQKIRDDRSRAAQQEQQANNAQKLAQAAQVASQTPTADGSTLLDKVQSRMAGGQQ